MPEPIPPSVLVTFIVSLDGEPLKPMTEEIARIDLAADGDPVNLDDLAFRVRRNIRLRWGQPAETTLRSEEKP